MEFTSRYVTIQDYINGAPSESEFEVKTRVIPSSIEGSNEIIVKNLFVSIDPYQINRFKTKSSSHKNTPGIVPGQVIDSFGIGKIVKSDNPEFRVGDLISGCLGWEEYSIVRGETIRRKITSSEFPLSFRRVGDSFTVTSHFLITLGLSFFIWIGIILVGFQRNGLHFLSFSLPAGVPLPLAPFLVLLELGIFDLSGFTAYVGLYKVGRPKKGERVFVSAASGSVGNVVGQLAKISGCYVVGSAGSKKKVDLLKDQLGFDDAFNYKEEDLNLALKRYFPDGIDIYFDNVGGEMLEAAIENMKIFGRVVSCGAISEYNEAARKTVLNTLDIIYKRISIMGFLTLDHIDDYNEFLSTVSDHLLHGRLQVIEDISEGINSIPSAFVSLFHGGNIGKKIVKLGE